MPIGSQSRSQRPVGPGSSENPSSNTAVYVAVRPKPKNIPTVLVPTSASAEEEKLPGYAESEAQAEIPKELLPPTSESDLEYFHALATLNTPHILPYSSMLVLNLFRTTQTHLFPVEERIALGSSLSTPFYALRASPSSKSVDEYNMLAITRRRPLTSEWHDAVTSEIQPGLKLISQGIMLISRLEFQRAAGRPKEFYDLTWASERGSYTVWKNNGCGVEAELEVFCDEWKSFDDMSQEGLITVASITHDPEAPYNRLAVMDFTKPSPQYIGLSPLGYKHLDLIIASLLTVAVVHTRRSKTISQKLVSVGVNSDQTTLVYQQTRARIRIDI